MRYEKLIKKGDKFKIKIYIETYNELYSIIHCDNLVIPAGDSEIR